MLRETRERRGLTLRQIANATKISVVALEALERDDISRLPGGIFSRAFVRAYAVEVGLDPEGTIQAFVETFPRDFVTAGHPTSSPIEDTVAFEGGRRTASAFLWMGLVSVPIIGALLYFSVVGWRTTEAEPQPAPGALSPVIPESRSGGSADDVLPAVTAPALPVGQPLPALEFDELPTAAPVVGTVGGLAVGLTATAPCRVVAIVDGRRAIDRLLQAGERRPLDVRHDLKLTVSDPSALVMTLNGRQARSLGRAGETVTVQLTLENFKGYLARQ